MRTELAWTNILAASNPYRWQRIPPEDPRWTYYYMTKEERKRWRKRSPQSRQRLLDEARVREDDADAAATRLTDVPRELTKAAFGRIFIQEVLFAKIGSAAK